MRTIGSFSVRVVFDYSHLHLFTHWVKFNFIDLTGFGPRFLVVWNMTDNSLLIHKMLTTGPRRAHLFVSSLLNINHDLTTHLLIIRCLEARNLASNADGSLTAPDETDTFGGISPKNQLHIELT